MFKIETPNISLQRLKEFSAMKNSAMRLLGAFHSTKEMPTEVLDFYNYVKTIKVNYFQLKPKDDDDTKNRNTEPKSDD